MFGLFGKAASKDTLLQFLEEANDVYIRAWETRSISLLKNHFTVKGARGIGTWIVQEASSRYFCDKKFRDVEWTQLERTDNFAKYRLVCTFRSQKLLLSGKSMKLSDDYAEIWSILIDGKSYRVDYVYYDEGYKV